VVVKGTKKEEKQPGPLIRCPKPQKNNAPIKSRPGGGKEPRGKDYNKENPALPPATHPMGEERKGKFRKQRH